MKINHDNTKVMQGLLYLLILALVGSAEAQQPGKALEQLFVGPVTGRPIVAIDGPVGPEILGETLRKSIIESGLLLGQNAVVLPIPYPPKASVETIV